MTRTLVLLAVATASLTTTGCTDSERARRAATFADRPADITCWTYGTATYNGRSTGKVEYDEGGRISFVDAANNRYTTVEGDCRVVYQGDGETSPEGPPIPPPPAPPAPAA